jgi:hypothetical protein
MIDALLAPVYKWLVLALLVGLCGLGLYCSHLSQKLDTAQTTVQQKVDKAVADAVKPYRDTQKLFEDSVYKLSGLYEDIKNNEATKTEVINNRVEKVTEHVVYRNVCLDADGVSILNEAGAIKYPP